MLENTDDDDDDVKVTYTWLSCTLAVVTSTAVIGTVRGSVVDVICNLYPNIHPSWHDYNPTEYLYQYQDVVLFLPFFI